MKLIYKPNSTLGSVVPLAMFVFIRDVIAEKMYQSSQRYMIGGLGLAVDVWYVRVDNGCKSFV